MALRVQHFLHEPTDTFSYVVWDDATGAAAIVDPVLDYDAASGRTHSGAAREIARYCAKQNLQVAWIVETHAHADHLSAGPGLVEELGGQLAIGAGISTVQATFREIFNLDDLYTDGRQFDRLFQDGETFAIGTLEAKVLATPGHASDSVSYLIEDAAFVGDALFAPDRGTARADFPGGNARTLYQSAQQLLALPEQTRIFLCHDYPDAERDHECVHSVAEHRHHNVHVGAGINEDGFVTLRESRDANLDLPTLIIPAVQINIRAGRFPPPEDNGTAYLKVPLNRFGRFLLAMGLYIVARTLPQVMQLRA